MSNDKKLFLNWSSGKDAALALHRILQESRYEVELLLTTLNLPQNRISMHGVSRELLLHQLKHLEIDVPSLIIDLPEMPDMDTYHSIMRPNLENLKMLGFKYAGFGDILLEDVKKYREEQLSIFDMEGVFPLWKRNTREVLEEFLEVGFKAIIVSSNASLLDKSFCGRMVDKDLLKDLPAGVDVCGENGEFHTFCFDGPIFKKPVSFQIGEKIYKEYDAPKTLDKEAPPRQKLGFWFCDLLYQCG